MGLSKDKIIEWRGKYNYPENEDCILNSVDSIKTSDDFRDILFRRDGILKWKGALRTKHYYQSLDSSKWQVFFDIIKGSTTEPKETVKKIVAFSKENMSYSGKYGGISYPVASTIVYFFSKGNGPIIDWRVVFALKNNGYNERIKGYQNYLDDKRWDNFFDLCHEIVSNLKIESIENDTPLRVLDKALWMYPDINNNLVQATIDEQFDGTKIPQHNGEDVEMIKNYKTHADMIREAVEEMGSAKPNSIMDFIRRKYPDIDVKETSFRADIIGCSVNHSSNHHYPGMPKFLFYDIEKGTYRLNDERLDNKTEHPLKIYEKLDPDLLKHIENSRDFVFADGALPKKFKLLIAMAFDASYGAVNGVKSLAQQALEEGATKEEITEALRVAQYISGIGCVYTGAQGLKDLL